MELSEQSTDSCLDEAQKTSSKAPIGLQHGEIQVELLHSFLHEKMDISTIHGCIENWWESKLIYPDYIMV
jgi:hypothetical protein